MKLFSRKRIPSYERQYQRQEACQRHDYEWFCTTCDKAYMARHWWAPECHCGLSQLFQRCRRCGRRGPNGG